MRAVVILAIVGFFSSSAWCANLETPHPRHSAFSIVPSFEANAGQVSEPTRFLLRNGPLTTLFERDGARFRLCGNAENDCGYASLRFRGAAPSSVVGDGELATRSNYFIGNDPAKWRVGVRHYSSIRYADAYPGIDIVFRINEASALEYDFVVRPGASVSDIRLVFDSTDEPTVDDEGAIRIGLGSSVLRQPPPKIFQQVDGIERRIPGRYRTLEAREIALDVGPYDTRLPLVIDPVITYSTYLGGTGFDLGWDVEVDGTGSVTVTGATQAADFPTEAPLQATGGGASQDIFVAKLNPSGSSLIFSTYLGGSELEGPGSLAVGNDGSIYVAGSTESSNYPTFNAFRSTLAGSGSYRDAVVTKLSPNGDALIYSTYIGGSRDDGATGLDIDSSDQAYVTGQTSSVDFPTAQAFQPSLRGGADVFILKLSADGQTLLYSTYFGGSRNDVSFRLAVTPQGSATIVGNTNSMNLPLESPLQGWRGDPPPATATQDAFVLKLTADGTQIFSTYLGGSNDDHITDLVLGGDGSIYFCGMTESSDFPTAAPIQGSLRGTADAVVGKITPNGSSLVFSTYYGGSDQEAAYGLALDAHGNVTVIGGTDSTDVPMVRPVQSALRGPSDTLVFSFSSSLDKVRFATPLGGSSGEMAFGITIDADNNVYFVGGTSSIDFPLRRPFRTSASKAEGFVVKLSEAGVYIR